MAPKFVTPHRKNGKNDGNDAEAICQAVGRPSMRFVPGKSAEQQALLSLHRVRQGFVVERTAAINRRRGLMAEFGVVLPQRSATVRRQAARAAGALPELARRMVAELLEQLRLLDARIEAYDRELGAHRVSRWALQLQGRCGYYQTLVAIANKNARIASATDCFGSVPLERAKRSHGSPPLGSLEEAGRITREMKVL
jgi:hypothetical protein